MHPDTFSAQMDALLKDADAQIADAFDPKKIAERDKRYRMVTEQRDTEDKLDGGE